MNFLRKVNFLLQYFTVLLFFTKKQEHGNCFPISSNKFAFLFP